MHFYIPIEPPSGPVNITTEGITSSEATLLWKESKPGSNPNGKFIITCTNCPPEHNFIQAKVTGTTVRLKSLGAYATYKIEIVKENNISLLTGKIRSANYTFTTLMGGIIKFIVFMHM